MSMLFTGARLHVTGPDGDPLAGGWVYTYAAGTTTPKASYNDSALSSPKANPFQLDAYGESTVWLDGAYKVNIEDSSHVQIPGYPVDNITSEGSSSDLTFIQAGSGAVPRSAQDKMREVVSVKDYGAVGDGVTDDTAAVQKAFNHAMSLAYAEIVFTPGGYVVTQINIPWGVHNQSLSISGAGAVIGHQGAQALFLFSGAPRCLGISDLQIISSTLKTDSEHAAFSFPDGVTKTSFTNIIYDGISPTTWGASFFYSDPDSVVDEVVFNNCLISCTGNGYTIGSGSSVWFVGGRVKGSYLSTPSYPSVGVLLCGGQGGVWVWGTDFIGHLYGWKSSQQNGLSNREVFFSQPAFDTCSIGLTIEDNNSWTSITGLWAASCANSIIAFSATSDFAHLDISGGTVFNAGYAAVGADLQSGIVMSGKGRMSITGVTFRENNNRGLYFTNDLAGVYSTVKDCQFYDNGSAIAGSCQAELTGRVIFENNYLNDSTYGVPKVFLNPATQSLLSLRNNRGLSGFGITTPPALAASGVLMTNTTGYLATVYITGGAVDIVAINGTNVIDYTPNAAANNMIMLNPGDTWAIAYSAAPTLQWYFH